MIKVLRQVENAILYFVVFLIPLIVLPIFPSAYVTPKLLLLTWGLGVILIFKAVRTIARGSLGFSTSSFDKQPQSTVMFSTLGVCSSCPLLGLRVWIAGQPNTAFTGQSLVRIFTVLDGAMR